MDRQFFLDLAARGLRMPIGTDLVLRAEAGSAADAEAIRRDGDRLGRVVARAAERWGTPLAVPLMDLAAAREHALRCLGATAVEADAGPIDFTPDAAALERFERALAGPLSERLEADVRAVRFVAGRTDLVPVAMTIGPFSLTTRLLADPITPVYLAGGSAGSPDDPEVARLAVMAQVAEKVVARSVRAQLEAGAKVLFVAEPAANKAYFSPIQMAEDPGVFDRFVTEPNRRLRRLAAGFGAELAFHCCGEVTDDMVRRFASLDPAILSLGSSRKLWEDAAIVPETTVLYGNLPSKRFFSDEMISEARVAEMAAELLRAMRATGHPFILGSECDVLAVDGAAATIERKVSAMLGARA